MEKGAISVADGLTSDPGDGRPALDMPTSRIGEILARSRGERRESLLDIADRIEWRFTPLVLRMIEAGAYPLTPFDVATLLRGYRVELGELRPRRNVLVIGDGEMTSGESNRSIGGDPVAARLLTEYVRFVRQLRKLSPGAPVPVESIRDEDLEVLAETLRVSVDTVETGVRAILRPRTIDHDDCVRLAQLHHTDVATIERHIANLCGSSDEEESDPLVG